MKLIGLTRLDGERLWVVRKQIVAFTSPIAGESEPKANAKITLTTGVWWWVVETVNDILGMVKK